MMPHADLKKHIMGALEHAWGQKIASFGDDDKFYLCKGQRPYVWCSVNKCAICGEQFSDDDLAHWDEINNRVLCASCHES